MDEGIKRERAGHIWHREGDDWYVEPRWCSYRLFDVERFEGAIYDPAVGSGRIVDAAREQGLIADGSDVIIRDPRFERVNFFDLEFSRPNIISNPPFRIFRKFAFHALALAARKVALMCPVRRLNAARWLQDTPLQTVHLLTPRPSMPPGKVVMDGDREPTGGMVDYCWLVWEQGYVGPHELRWLHRIGHQLDLANRKDLGKEGATDEQDAVADA